MRLIGRRIEQSLAIHTGPEDSEITKQRLAEINSIDNPFKRAVALSLESLTLHHRTAAEHLLSGIARVTAGVTYLGNGAMSSVYRSGDQVIKVHRPTVGQSSEAMADYARVHQGLCEVAASHLGYIVVPQEFYVGVHPIGRYPVVLSRQAFTTGDRLDLFTPGTADLNRPDIDEYCDREESGLSQLENLVNGTFACDELAGCVPDLNGADNFRVTANGLQLIDGVPIPRDAFPKVHSRILQQAEVLGTFVTSA